MNSGVDLKNRNLSDVFHIIYERERISKQDISIQTGLSLPTVSQNLKSLSRSGLIDTKGVFESTGGRKAKIIRCVGDSRLAIGIDITKNHLSFVAVDLYRNIICSDIRIRFPYNNTNSYYNKVCQKLDTFLDRNKINRDKILGVGISLPCIISQYDNRVTYAKVINAPENIIDEFSRRISFRTQLFNDANAAGFAERWNSKLNGMLVYLSLSNSVGGAIISNNNIYYGDCCRSAEFGHIRVVPGGKKCYCGQSGCLDAYCSARVLSEDLGIKLETFFEELNKGNKTYAHIFRKYMDYLAIAVIDLRMTFDCDVILGGYVGAYMDEYIDEFRKKVSCLNSFEKDGNFVRPCIYRNEASAVGAGLNFINEFISQI